MVLSLTQRRVLAIVPKITGLCSMIGSLVIITDVARDPKKRSQTYTRIMMAMSCYDFVTSCMYALSTWPIPRGSGPLYAAGTTGTCTAQGFFIQLSLGAPLYNLSLAVYYLLVIKHGWSDVKLAKLERFVHPVVAATAFGIAIAGLPLKLYNNSNVWCWIAPNDRMNSNVNANFYRWAFFYVELWLIIVIVTVIMMAVVVNVVQTANKTTRYSVQTTNKTKRYSFRGMDAKLSTTVKKQALYYVSAFYVTWLALTILRILQTADVQVPYAIFVLAVLLTPLQGFFNFLIYMKPRYLRYRRRRRKKQQKMELSGKNSQFRASMNFGASHVQNGLVVSSSINLTSVQNSNQDLQHQSDLIEDNDDEEAYVDAEVSLAFSNRQSKPNIVGLTSNELNISSDKEEEKEEELERIHSKEEIADQLKNRRVELDTDIEKTQQQIDNCHDDQLEDLQKQMMEYQQLRKELYPSDEEEGAMMEEDEKSRDDKEEEAEEEKEGEEKVSDEDEKMGSTEQIPEATGFNNSDVESVAMNVDIDKEKEDEIISGTVRS